MPLNYNITDQRGFMVSGGVRRASSRSMTAPMGGWNTREPLPSMPPEFAIRLDNWFPNTRTCDIRKGFRVHSSGMGSGTVETLANHVSAAGAEKLIAFANGNIYDATTLSGTATSKASGFTNNKWSTVNFNHTLVCVNGADQPKQYDGSTVTDATYTGTDPDSSALDDADLVQVTSYRSRLYFLHNNSSWLWYGGVDSTTGALTAVDYSSEFQLGGKIQAISSWNVDAGDGVQTYFVMISEMGEILIYGGPNPGDSEWGIVNHSYLPKPLGRNCLFRLSAELFVITEQGIIPLSQFVSPRRTGTFEKLSENINSQFSNVAATTASNYGWTAQNYPRCNMLLINVPISGDVRYDQYVMNTLTGAWCRFTGLNGADWVEHNSKLYFGGTDGVVYEANYGASDNGSPIPVDLQTSFNYLDDFSNKKHFTLARANLVANGDITIKFDIDTDFQTQTITDTITLTGILGPAWDAVKWDSTKWGQSEIINQDWTGVSGIGRSVSCRLKGDCKDLSLSLSSVDIIYTLGGLL